MAFFKPKEDDLFHSSLVPVTAEFYVFLVGAAESQLKEELRFITAKRLRSIVKQYAEERCRPNVICVTHRGSVRLTLFLQDLFFYEDHAVVELHVSLPILGSPSEHEEVWRRLLSGNFPNHGLRDGDLCMFVEFHGDDLPEKVNGVFRRKSSK
jgi:hypothetical protein